MSSEVIVNVREVLRGDLRKVEIVLGTGDGGRATEVWVRPESDALGEALMQCRMDIQEEFSLTDSAFDGIRKAYVESITGDAIRAKARDAQISALVDKRRETGDGRPEEEIRAEVESDGSTSLTTTVEELPYRYSVIMGKFWNRTSHERILQQVCDADGKGLFRSLDEVRGLPTRVVNALSVEINKILLERALPNLEPRS